MTAKLQLMAIWAFLGAMIFASIGVIFVARFIPPHAPSWDARTVASLYTESRTRIIAGFVMYQAVIGFFAPFITVIFLQLRRIEGGRPPMISVTYLTASIITNLVLAIVPVIFFVTAAFRPERNPEITQMLNDLGWFWFTFPLSIAAFMFLAIGMGLLQDRQAQPLFPRWVGYFNLWVAASNFPSFILPFFMTGPLAWNGVIAYWVPLIVFGIWMAVMIVYLVKAIKRDDYEPVNF